MPTKVMIAALGLMFVLTSQTACGFGRTSADTASPIVLAEAGGICPPRVVYIRTPTECRVTKQWNGATPMFNTPRREWGVAYAFNCGTRARDFFFDERLPGMDHMALPGPLLHAKHGSGYLMISRTKMVRLLSAVPRQFELDGELMEVDVGTGCTWHVKAILGSRSDVAADVPPIPAVQTPWWQTKDLQVAG